MPDLDDRIRNGLNRLVGPDGSGDPPSWGELDARRRRRRVRRAFAMVVPVLAVLALVGAVAVFNQGPDDTSVATGSLKGGEELTPPGTNLDGTPAAELVSPHSHSIDELRAANERIAQCMRDEGFTATVDARGEGVEVASDPGRPVADAMKTCRDEFGLPEFEYTQQELMRLYEATVRQAQCIEQVAGVDLGEPPPADLWIQNHGSWTPLDELGKALDAAGDEEPGIRDRARILCPTPR